MSATSESSTVRAKACTALGADQRRLESYPSRETNLGELRVSRMLPVRDRLSRLETSSAPVSPWLHAGFNRPGRRHLRYGDVRGALGRRCRLDVDRHTAGGQRAGLEERAKGGSR
jgi:hypothetical protein